MEEEDCKDKGLAIIVMKENKILMGLRKGGRGSGCWGFPGGRQGLGECAVDGARRELDEEVYVKVSFTDEEPCETTDDYFEREKKHYRTMYFRALYIDGVPEELDPKEPDKCWKWNWFEWNNLPYPLFLPVVNLLRKGYNPFKR